MMGLVIAIGILIIVMSFLGMPLSTTVKASKLPAWAKFRATNLWGNPWIDSKVWLKVILIRIAQSVIIIVLFFFNVIFFGAKSIIKKLESVAKK